MKNNESPITLVHVSAHYPPKIGGMERVVKTVAEQLAERNHHVRVITTDDGIDKSLIEKSPNPDVIFLKSFDFAHTPIAPMLLLHLLRIPKRSIIHLHLAQAYFPEMVLFVSKLKAIPYIVHFHLDVGPSGKLGALFLIYKKLVWTPVLRSAQRVIVFSEEQKVLVAKKYGVSESIIVIIPNGVGKDFFASYPKETFHSPIRLLYVGRLAKQKRVERLIYALSITSIPLELTVVGEGEDRPMLEELVQKYNLKNVTFAGKKYGEELISYYENADMLVMPSDIEGMPLVGLEAMAAALPIVGSDVPGIHELIEGIGVLVADPSAETFAAAITDLAADQEKWRELSKKSLEQAQNYSWERLVNMLERVYNEVLV